MLNLIRKCPKLNDFEYVVKHSSNVKINTTKLHEFTNNLEISDKILNKHIFIDLKKKVEEKILITFLILCESINFCYWNSDEWIYKYKNKNYSGSMALFMAMKKKIEDNVDFFHIDNLISIKYKDFKSIFPFILDENRALLPLRYKIFVENVNIIYDKRLVFFDNILKCSCDLDLLKYIISIFPNFNDYSYYKLKKIMFHKRANLLIKDMYELNSNIKNNIKSLKNLYACADYRLPQILSSYGVITYSDKLLSIINNDIIINHNSKLEVEIRSSTILAVELIKKELQKKNIYIDSIYIDNILWNYARSKKQSSSKFHKTISQYY